MTVLNWCFLFGLLGVNVGMLVYVNLDLYKQVKKDVERMEIEKERCIEKEE